MEKMGEGEIETEQTPASSPRTDKLKTPFIPCKADLWNSLPPGVATAEMDLRENPRFKGAGQFIGSYEVNQW